VNHELIGGLIMKKVSILLLAFICFISLFGNVIQYKKISSLEKDTKFYNERYKSDFKELIESIDMCKGLKTSLSNENAIKNSVLVVTRLASDRTFSKYANNKSLSLMELYLSEFFVLEPNEFINKNINDVKEYLIDISKDLSSSQKIDNFNNFLWQYVKNVY
jgi:hypothetical protein